MIKRDAAEEVKQLADLLKQKPEIDQKVEFYKNVLLTQENLHEAITERMERGYVTETYKILGFIPIRKRVVLDSVEKARLNIEKFEIEDKIWAQKQYFEMWLSRSKEYDTKFDEITRDCNENYDAVYADAEKVALTNLRLKHSMERYEKEEDKNQKLKNEFFLYIKKEVENFRTHGKKHKFSPKPQPQKSQ